MHITQTQHTGGSFAELNKKKIQFEQTDSNGSMLLAMNNPNVGR